MSADVNLLAFAKEGYVSWKRKFLREKRLPTTNFSKSRWRLISERGGDSQTKSSINCIFENSCVTTLYFEDGRAHVNLL